MNKDQFMHVWRCGYKKDKIAKLFFWRDEKLAQTEFTRMFKEHFNGE